MDDLILLLIVGLEKLFKRWANGGAAPPRSNPALRPMRQPAVRPGVRPSGGRPVGVGQRGPLPSLPRMPGSALGRVKPTVPVPPRARIARPVAAAGGVAGVSTVVGVKGVAGVRPAGQQAPVSRRISAAELRRQIVWNEILQPPVALREPR